MKKVYVIDSSVILNNAAALFSFDEHTCVVPDIVLSEIDSKKREPGEVGVNAREAARALDRIRQNGDLVKGVELPNGGMLRVEINNCETKLPQSWPDTNDHRILRVCKGLREKGEPAILVSNDVYLRVKASVLGIPAEEFRTEIAPLPDESYQGRRTAYITDEKVNEFYTKKKLKESDLIYFDENGTKTKGLPLVKNEYLLLICQGNPKKTALAYFDGSFIVPIMSELHPFGVTAKNVGQKFCLDAIMRNTDEAPLVIIKGPAGTGKTLLALASGLEGVVEHHQFRKILYLRTNSNTDEGIGFIPGTEKEKLAWQLRPVRDNLEILVDRTEDRYANEMILKDKVDEIFDREYIVVEAISFIRGRSIAQTFVIIDEAQNCTPKLVRTLLSRCSKNTKVILLGDPDQVDGIGLSHRTNGLCYAADRMKGSSLCRQVTLTSDECERSPLAEEISNRMADK